MQYSPKPLVTKAIELIAAMSLDPFPIYRAAKRPCGLTQLIALRYGMIPIVHEIGGLKDTVKPFNEYEDTGTGFSFHNYTGGDLLDRIKHAEWIWYSRHELWDHMQKRGMEEDWSWKKSAEIYKDLYSRM